MNDTAWKPFAASPASLIRPSSPVGPIAVGRRGQALQLGLLEVGGGLREGEDRHDGVGLLGLDLADDRAVVRALELRHDLVDLHAGVDGLGRRRDVLGHVLERGGIAADDDDVLGAVFGGPRADRGGLLLVERLVAVQQRLGRVVPVGGAAVRVDDRHLGLVEDVRERRGRRGGAVGADDRDDLVRADELARGLDRLLRVERVVAGDELDLAAVDAAFGVDLRRTPRPRPPSAGFPTRPPGPVSGNQPPSLIGSLAPPEPPPDAAPPPPPQAVIVRAAAAAASTDAMRISPSSPHLGCLSQEIDLRSLQAF